MIQKNMNGRNYLVQERDTDHTLSKLSLKMMEKNELHGLLPFRNVQQESEVYYRYTLHSDEMLSQWLERVHTRKQVLCMLEDFLTVEHELERYLLPQEHLCTELQLVSVVHNQCEFAYVPEEEYVQDGLFALAKYILFQVKYATDEDFSYLFDLQNAVNRGDIRSMEDFGKWLRIINGIEKDDREEDEPEVRQEMPFKKEFEPQERMPEEFARQERGVQEQLNISSDVLSDFQLDNAKPKKAASKGFFGRKAKNEPKEEPVPVKVSQVVPEYRADVVKPDIINDLNREGDTVLTMEGMGDILVRSRTGEEYNLIQESYILGSIAQADIVISDNHTISRRHAKIFLNGGFHFIEDLGSTNGTTVNGEVLRRNEPYKLENMSRIMLSDEEFIYETRR